jgi:uncharacterized protein YjaZ
LFDGLRKRGDEEMTLKHLIQTTWQLPQNIAGLIAKKIFKATQYTTYKDTNVYLYKLKQGVSLGNYIFLPQNIAQNKVQQYIKHEYGHTVQSKYLGWLYLLVIGLPSFIWAGCFAEYRKKTGKSYYSFYTESWADKLGEVER